MSSKTNIEWCDATWNPTRGCSRVSPGCQNCYAERTAARQMHSAYKDLVRSTADGPQWTGLLRIAGDDTFDAPAHWRKPRRIFVDSMSDLFHEDMPFPRIADVWRVMALPECGRHTFQILTKRAKRMRRFMEEAATLAKAWPWPDPDHVLSNVWLGVSVEDRARKDRIEALRATPAALRFLSLEPLLEDLGPIDFTGIGWAIAGGESGPGARPCDVAWIRSIVAQCREAGVPCFVKQIGSRPQYQEYADMSDDAFRAWDSKHAGEPVPLGGLIVHPLDRKGGDPSEWPEDLRVREFPATASLL